MIISAFEQAPISNHHRKEIDEKIPTVKFFKFEYLLSHKLDPNKKIKNKNNVDLGEKQ